MSDEQQIIGTTWERQPGESAKAHAAARCYFELGPDRSLDEVHRKFGKSTRLLARWSSEWNWVERAQSYDAHIHAFEQQAKERAITEEANKWAERRAAQREAEYTVAQKLLERAQTMLTFPLAVVEKTIEGEKTVINPTRWSMRDAARLSDVASKLARLVLELETDRTQLDVNLSELTDEQLEAIISARRGGRA